MLRLSADQALFWLSLDSRQGLGAIKRGLSMCGHFFLPFWLSTLSFH